MSGLAFGDGRIISLAAVDQPKWAVGDTWMIETVSEKIQGREAEPARKSPPIRWQTPKSDD